MEETPESLMLDIEVLRERYDTLNRQSLEQFIEAGGGLNEAEELIDRGEEPPERVAEAVRGALARGGAYQKQMLEIDCQTVDLLERLAAITTKKQYGKYLTRIRLTPRHLYKMRRLRDKWTLFQQALTWEEDRVERGAMSTVDELTVDDALKLIKVFERERDRPLDPRNMTLAGTLKLITEGQLGISMSNRQQASNMLKVGHAIALLRSKSPDDWQRLVRESFPEENLVNLATLYHENWPRIQPLLEAEAAHAVAAGHTYYHPTVKQALRMVGALPPLENDGIIPLPPDDMAFLEHIAAKTGMPKVELSWQLAIARSTKGVGQAFADVQNAKYFDVEEYLLARGLLRELK